MKIKVLDYKADGNTITTKFYEAEQYTHGVFISKDKESNSNLYLIIFGDINKNVYIKDGYYSLETIEANKEYLTKIPADFMKFALEKPFVRNIDIEFAKQCGFDYQILIKRREEILALKKEEEAQKEIQNRQKAEEYAVKENKRIDECLQSLKDGKKISYKDLLDIIEKYKIKIAPRTLGAIRKQVESYSYINIERGYFKPKTAQTTINSIFKVVKEVAEIQLKKN